jgi:glycosyltransferase involved in cell wall biosynthesis
MKRIVVLHEMEDPHWRWVSHHMPEFDWSFVFARPATGQIGNRLSRLRAAFAAVRLAKSADLIISFGLGLGSVIEIARRLVGVNTKHCCYYLNFDELPQGLKRSRQAAICKSIDRFVVSSTIERALYAAHFGIDPHRIDMLLWGVNPPEVSNTVLVAGDYVCAVGGNARDYPMLMDVARARPDIAFVVVVRPANLEGLNVPPNVRTFTNIPFADAMAVVRDARVMALPLVTTQTPCGHVTIVGAFYLGTPIVVTASTGIEDYVQDEITGLTAPSGSAAAFGAAIDRMWNDPAMAQRIGAAGAAFANAHCTEANYPQHVRAMLAD